MAGMSDEKRRRTGGVRRLAVVSLPEGTGVTDCEETIGPLARMMNRRTWLLAAFPGSRYKFNPPVINLK